jgi:hypothetical protein
MASRAEIIDDFFREQDAFPQVPYQPLGADLVGECESMGPDGLFVSTAAALVEKESGGKNIFGCDFGERFTTDPPFCQVAVTKERVKRLIDNFHQPPPGIGANGIGVTQITSMDLVEQAERIGGSHLVRHQMRVGFGLLNRLIAMFGWPEGAAAYNAGPGNLLSVMDTYGADMARKERQWAQRLEGASDAPTVDGGVAGIVGGEATDESSLQAIWLVPESFVPLKPKPGTFPPLRYIDVHPTRYQWRKDVARVIRRLYRQFGSDNIKINTYVQHPGDEGGIFARDTTSFDVWGPGGRMAGPEKGELGPNFFLPPVLGEQIFDFLFEDPNPPDIDWIIYQREIRISSERYHSRPFGFDAFTFHDDHIHVTYLGDFELLD